MTRHQKRMLKQATKQICLHILFIVICFVTLIPILYALSVSLNADNSLVSSDFRFIPKNFTLRNYVAVFTEEPVMLWFKNSMTLAVVTVVISLAAGAQADIEAVGSAVLFPVCPFHVCDLYTAAPAGADQQQSWLDSDLYRNDG